MTADQLLREIKELAERTKYGASRMRYDRMHRYEDDAEKLAALVIELDRLLSRGDALPREWRMRK